MAPTCGHTEMRFALAHENQVESKNSWACPGILICHLKSMQGSCHSIGGGRSGSASTDRYLAMEGMLPSISHPSQSVSVPNPQPSVPNIQNNAWPHIHDYQRRLLDCARQPLSHDYNKIPAQTSIFGAFSTFNEIAPINNWWDSDSAEESLTSASSPSWSDTSSTLDAENSFSDEASDEEAHSDEYVDQCVNHVRMKTWRHAPVAWNDIDGYEADDEGC